MTAKTITMALAATTAAAALADVVEVKFTVKTENEDTKVASKVISGLYDSDQDKHVFWTVEKRTNEKGKAYNANVAYTNTYFGFTQDGDGTYATKAKQYGQNAELIWGDAEEPENVLVAGAWGKAASKSGQVAGIIDGKPANGTWSAKKNTKMTFDQLVAKYKVEDADLVVNRANGVIDQVKENAAADVEAAYEALAGIEGQLDTIVEALTNLNDRSAFNMIGKSIKSNYTEADKLYKSASNNVDKANAAYDAYAAAVNKSTEELEADVANAKEAKAEAEVAKAEADWTKTLMQAFTTGGYEAVSNEIEEAIGEIQKKISANNDLIKAENYDAALALLEKQIAAGYMAITNEVNNAELDSVKYGLGTYVVMTNAEAVLEKAKAFADGGYLTEAWNGETVYAEFEEFAAENKYTGLDVNGNAMFDSSAKYPEEDATVASLAWVQYRADRAEFAEGVQETAQTALDDADRANNEAKATVADLEDQLKTLKTDGKTATTIELEKQNKEYQDQIDALKAQITEWKTKAVSQADVDAAVKAAEEAAEALKQAEEAVTAAENARDDITNTRATLLDNLAKAIGLTGKTDLEKDGKALPLAEIAVEVNDYVTTQEGLKAQAKATIAYAQELADTIGLDLTK